LEYSHENPAVNAGISCFIASQLQPILAARNLGVIVRSIAEDLHIKPRVKVAMA
jgi:hypothetical protein